MTRSFFTPTLSFILSSFIRGSIKRNQMLCYSSSASGVAATPPPAKNATFIQSTHRSSHSIYFPRPTDVYAGQPRVSFSASAAAVSLIFLPLLLLYYPSCPTTYTSTLTWTVRPSSFCLLLMIKGGLLDVDGRPNLMGF